MQYCKNLFKSLFYHMLHKSITDRSGLFFFSRQREYYVFLKKLSKFLKKKYIWLHLYKASKVFFNSRRYFFVDNYLSKSVKGSISNNVGKNWPLCQQFKVKNFFFKSIFWFLEQNLTKQIKSFLMLKKKKMFLLKYLNLVYSLKLSSVFRTIINCFFISCVSIFTKREKMLKNVVF